MLGFVFVLRNRSSLAAPTIAEYRPMPSCNRFTCSSWPRTVTADRTIADSAMLSAKLVRGATLKVYRGGSHGMCTVNKNEVNEYLLAFIKR